MRNCSRGDITVRRSTMISQPHLSLVPGVLLVCGFHTVISDPQELPQEIAASHRAVFTENLGIEKKPRSWQLARG
jgi:hypothetical protein